MRKPRILVCDDEPVARRGAARALGAESYEILECIDGRECLAALERPRHGVDLILLDLRMPGMDGMTTLAHLTAMPAPPPVVVVTADSSLRSAIEAVKAGAADFLAKPYEIDELRFVVAKTLETARLRTENRRLAEEVKRLAGSRRLSGESPAMRAVMDAIERVGPAAAGVLIRGESGTGKELVARQIHELSERARGAFVAVNCAAIPDTLVESELFGHRRGAFTGADRDRPGKFRQADGGTLFLDEVGDMALAAQAKLLRVLQEGIVEPLGGGDPVAVDVRVLAATHRDLKAMAAEGRFREDLLFRLRVVEIELPPLRERAGDILLLARQFLAASSARRPLAGAGDRAGAPRLPLAGQRPRAGQRRRAGDDLLPRPDDPARGSPAGGARRRRTGGGGRSPGLGSGGRFSDRQAQARRALRARRARRGPARARRQHFPSRPQARPAPPEPPAEAARAGDRGGELPWGSELIAIRGRRKPPFLRMLLAMSDQLRDPELDQLVRSLNRAELLPASRTSLSLPKPPNPPAP